MMYRDATGREHEMIGLDGPAPRIVSLVPSITELLCDLGLAPWLVGRTGFCIHPSQVVALIPKIGGTKGVNIDKIRALDATHLIVNIDENEKPTVEQLAQFVPNVIVTHPLAPRDNPDLYRLLGGIFRAGAQTERLCKQFETEYTAVQALPLRPPQRVLYCIWKDPWMTVSAGTTYIGNMLAAIGWHNCSALPDTSNAARYPAFAWSPALLQQVDRILLSSEPYRFTADHAEQLQLQTGKPVQLVDGEMLSWYGSRAIAGLRYLRHLALNA
jgi:ABC-type Fe3+-hydroxamate transport system substrate-binding protein